MENKDKNIMNIEKKSIIKMICLMEGIFENVEYHGSREDFLKNIKDERLIQVFYEGKEIWFNTDYIMSFEI